ncbi:MAG: hypothetical protein R3C69_13710 [Geminicoccaceae bacterium]
MAGPSADTSSTCRPWRQPRHRRHRWDEALRFGLASFKALGGAYAVRRLLEGRLFAEREGDRHRTRPSTARFARGVTVTTCATDGNHGRSVA